MALCVFESFGLVKQIVLIFLAKQFVRIKKIDMAEFYLPLRTIFFSIYSLISISGSLMYKQELSQNGDFRYWQILHVPSDFDGLSHLRRAGMVIHVYAE